MQDKILRQLINTIVNKIAGQGASVIADLLYGKKNVNEFLIAKKMKINVNQARNLLYKLSEQGLVSFIKKKDKSNGGWYTYYWTINVGKSLEVSRRNLIEEVAHLEQQLGIRKTERFYHCRNCDIELNEENALLNNFTCPECGEVLELRDNSNVIEEIQKNISTLQTYLGVLNEHLGEIGKKDQSVRMRKVRAEKKKRATERDVKRKEKLKLQAKMEKDAKKKKSDKGKKKKR